MAQSSYDVNPTLVQILEISNNMQDFQAAINMALQYETDPSKRYEILKALFQMKMDEATKLIKH